MAQSSATKIGHSLAKVLGIKINYRNELNEEIRRGESVFSSQTAGAYVEEEPRSIEWVQDVIPSGPELVEYGKSLFPFLHWIGSYNIQWLIGDLVAGKISPTIRYYRSANNGVQVLPLVLLSFLKAWLTLLWLLSLSNTVSTLRSWASSSTGFSQHPRISPLV